MADKEGLTKPLINNVGGMIDQDAPSADQLLEGRSERSWGSEPVVKGHEHGRSPAEEHESMIHGPGAGPLSSSNGPKFTPEDNRA